MVNIINYNGRIGGLEHFILNYTNYNPLVTRTFRDQEYTNILDGEEYKKRIIHELRHITDNLDSLLDINPQDYRMEVIVVGREDDQKLRPIFGYVNKKALAAEDAGLVSKTNQLDEDITEAKLGKVVRKLKKEKGVTFMIQLPFGGDAEKNINPKNLFKLIPPIKDVDGLNQKTFKMKLPHFIPCTSLAMHKLVGAYLYLNKQTPLMPDGIVDYTGWTALVAGRSNVVGGPVYEILKNHNCTLIGPIHTGTGSYGEKDPETKRIVCTKMSTAADIIFSSLGDYPYDIHKNRKNEEKSDYFFTEDMIEKGSIIVDASTKYYDGKTHGDVDPRARHKTSATTVELGCVGPMTVGTLIEQNLKGILYQNIDKACNFLKAHENKVLEIFGSILGNYFKDAKSIDIVTKTKELYQRAINPYHKHSSLVHTVDAFLAIMPFINREVKMNY